MCLKVVYKIKIKENLVTLKVKLFLLNIYKIISRFNKLKMKLYQIFNIIIILTVFKKLSYVIHSIIIILRNQFVKDNLVVRKLIKLFKKFQKT
jgi:hypothetical protein